MLHFLRAAKCGPSSIRPCTYVFPAQSLLACLTVDVCDLMLAGSEHSLLYNTRTDINAIKHNRGERASHFGCLKGNEKDVHIAKKVGRSTDTLKLLEREQHQVVLGRETANFTPTAL